MVADAAFVTEPPALKSTPVVPAILPELTTLPTAPLMSTPQSPPAIADAVLPLIEAEAALVTEPPAPRSPPFPAVPVPEMVPEFPTEPALPPMDTPSVPPKIDAEVALVTAP